MNFNFRFGEAIFAGVIFCCVATAIAFASFGLDQMENRIKALEQNPAIRGATNSLPIIEKPAFTTAEDGAIYFQLQGHSFYSLPKGAFMEMAVFHSAGCPCRWRFSTNSVKSGK